MAINFTDSPSVNDTVTQGDHTWTWDGTTWNLTVASATAVAGSNTQVQYNSSGSLAGSANLTFDGTNLTVAGELDAATLDISGNADIDGTTNLDAVDIDGAVQIDNTVTVGVDDTGHDVKFFGATSGKYMLWDESADSLIVNGPVFAAAKMQTGQTSYTQEPWNNSTIALGNYGSVGTQGSYRTSLAWNYERGTDSAFHHLDINSYPQAVGIDLGHTGILFNADEDYENNHTTNPTTHMIMTPAGKVGIGDTSPLHTLEIHSDDDLTSFTGTGLGVMKLVNNQYDSGDFTALDFGYSGNNYALGRIATKITGSGSSMHFGTSNSYASGITNTAMTIDLSGNVGIGTTTPMRELDVWSEIMAHYGDDAWLWQNAGSSQFRLWFQDSYTSGDGGWSQKIQVDSSGSTDLQILGGYDVGYTQGSVMITAYDQQRGAGTYYFNAYSDRTWYSGMPYGNDDVFAVSRATGSTLSTAAASSATAHMMFYIDNSGNAYNKTDSWGGISDERLKINVADARSYLTDLNRLRVVTYQLGNQMVFDEGTITYEPLDEPSEKMLGLVAQEVEQVFPSMVVEHTGVKTVKTSVLIPMLLKAVQELTTRVAALEGS